LVAVACFLPGQAKDLSAPSHIWGMWSTPCSGHFTPRKRPGVHCTGGWVDPEPVWADAENLPPPGFNPWIAQPLASHYTNYTISVPATGPRSKNLVRAHYQQINNYKITDKLI